jgi:hypothetical protein
VPSTAVDPDGEYRMDLVPGVLGVIDPGPGQLDPLADAWCRQVSVIAGHQLDDQKPILLAVVAGGQEALVLDRDVECRSPSSS